MGEEMEVYDTGARYKPFVGKTLRFMVKAAHDVHIAFTTKEGDSTPMFEVLIGGWEGEYSAVRFKKDDLVKEHTPDILSADESREFWIATDHDEVRVGRGGEHEPFLSCALPEPMNPTFDTLEADDPHYTLPKPVNPTFFGFSTGWGSTGAFQFLHERNIATKGKLEYRYEPLYGDTFTFTVSCDHDAQLCFTMGPEQTPLMYEVFIGRSTIGFPWSDQHCLIMKNKYEPVKAVKTPNECSGDPKTYWVNLRGGYVRVFRQGSTEPFMDWRDSVPFKVTHVGICTGKGARGQWKLDV